MKLRAKLKNWHIVGDVLVGTVYRHWKYDDGTEIQTEEIEKLYWTKEGPRAATKRMIYELKDSNMDDVRYSYVHSELLDFKDEKLVAYFRDYIL